MKKRIQFKRYGWIALLVGVLGLLWTVDKPLAVQALFSPAPTVTRPAGQPGTVLIPDQFLRRWDPVTVFFSSSMGPSKSGPEDHPEKFVTLNPSHPGAFSWIDARTLQFKPTIPWPPLSRYTWHAGSKTLSLSTLMAPPMETQPRDGAEGLSPVDSIVLTFPDPIEPEALADMIRIELSPLPGLGGGSSRWRTKEDFEVKTMERRSISERARYVIALKNPIPLGIRATMRFRLSLDDAATESFAELVFSTAEPFRVSTLGCSNSRVPLTPDGSLYARDQALKCDSGERTVVAEFTAEPREISPMLARNLVRFEPAVEDLSFDASGRRLEISGAFEWDTLYKVMLSPTVMQDVNGRTLDARGQSAVYVYFPRRAPFMHWASSQGVVERYGAQMVPIEARGQERVDLRIYSVDPLDRSFWPFPSSPVQLDESLRPPGPGEIPQPYTDTDSNFGQDISQGELRKQIAALTSPPFSRLVDLPVRKEQGAGTFGLNLEPHLSFISGARKAGTYLVGLRRLDGSSHRSWMRIQVTDLSLSVIEEADDVEFAVTSLSTGRPVSGATIRLEGNWRRPKNREMVHWDTHWEGRTDGDGRVRWHTPGRGESRRLRRIVVQKGDDILVLDPKHPPETYADNHWGSSGDIWLQWAFEHTGSRKPSPSALCHVFTERPVYRPDEEVHIKGYIRHRGEGKLTAYSAPKTELVVDGPGNLAWTYPVQLTGAGDFYYKFDEEKLPSGEYRAYVKAANCQNQGYVTFKKEAYRIPKFEVKVHAPDQVPLDGFFEASMTASYYAGGRVSEVPVRWRVTQYPYTWTPSKLEGFLYSSDGRFSGMSRFESTGGIDREDLTDENGQQTITINPALEPTAQPRTYVIEATVTGLDDQTVTTTRSVHALPAVVLGLEVPRYIERATEIRPAVIAVGPDGKLKPGQEIRVRLLNRQWHSHLRASDFSDGVARYITDVVDERVLETTVTSLDTPLPVPLKLPRSGVYIVEIETQDRLGRAQVVSVDLYAGGDEALSWSKPEANVFTVTPDRNEYAPGRTAKLVVQSPFQEASALVILEGPDKNTYWWQSVKGGSTTIKVPILKTYVPRVPVHVVLMRGRLEGVLPKPGKTEDLGRPTTMAATAWLTVSPVENRVEVALEHEKKKQPGQKLPLKVKLSTPSGAPLFGEVTLWLVDRAVRSLGTEQRLDPLPDFITSVYSRLKLRDTRNLVFGLLPFNANPGGGEADEESPELLERVTVRKNFKTVPYYNPELKVGPSGVAEVVIDLPDNLTVFDIRAKAVSGPDRFGFAKSDVAVRLPLIVQPNLPRFVRAGDRFVASAIGRVVEGEGGAGWVSMKATGVKVKGKTQRSLTWDPKQPIRLDFPVEVSTPTYGTGDDGTEGKSASNGNRGTSGNSAADSISFTVAVERASDNASDAFQVSLPLLPDRPAIQDRMLVNLEPGKAAKLPAIPGKVRAGTLTRSLLLSDQPKLVRMAAGLEFLRQYPFGCTEQRVSRARAYLALEQFREVLRLELTDDELDRAITQTLDYLPNAVDGAGLMAFWPGSRGYVSLTAWVADFLTEAKAAGYNVDPKLYGGLLRELEKALRSDYSRFVDGAAYIERAWALSALANADRFSESYASELSRRAQYLNQESRAQVVLAFAQAGKADSPAVGPLVKSLWDGMVFRLYQGKEIYGGLQDDMARFRGEILPTETRALAETARALRRTAAQQSTDSNRLPLLVDALTTLGKGDGWGTTNANAAALLALAEQLKPSAGTSGNRWGTSKAEAGSHVYDVNVKLGEETTKLSIGPGEPVAFQRSSSSQGGEAKTARASGEGPLVLRLDSRYVPLEPGSRMETDAQGFVVSRELLKIQTDGAPPKKSLLDKAGLELEFEVGDVIEDHVQVVNPEDRFYVAIQVPLSAGIEPLNPNLATAPPEATPSHSQTFRPTYASYMDDHVAFYYNSLPKGTYDFYFRTRANVPGSYSQPGAFAEMMYNGTVRGNSFGARVEIGRGEEEP